jgi:hypothetical protein
VVDVEGITPDAKPLHPAFVAALEADREALNQRFRAQSLQGPPLDASAFFEHLVHRVEPLVAATFAHFPERSRSVTTELYSVSLDLFRAGYWGKESRLPALNQLWEQTLPKLARLVAREPNRVTGALSNALIHVAQQQDARAHDWLARLSSLGDRCHSVNELLAVTMVLAWRCGMAQLREGALERLERLPADLAASCMNETEAHDGEANAIDESAWQATLERLRRDRWSDISESQSSLMPVLAKYVGAFRGFGGSFTRPPIVFLHQTRLMVTDQTTVWRLFADAYGWHLQRQGNADEFALPDLQPSKRAAVTDAEPVFGSDGHLRWNGHEQRFAYLAGASSHAFDGQTLAVALPTSFHIFIVACTTPNRSIQKSNSLANTA